LFGSSSLLLDSIGSSSFPIDLFGAFHFLSILNGSFAFLPLLIGSIGKKWNFHVSLVFGESFGEFLKRRTLIHFYKSASSISNSS